MPPRKSADEQAESAEPAVKSTPTPPGPHQLEIRYNGKIVCLQRVHSYTIDQQDDALHVHGVLRLPVSDVQPE